MYSVSSGFLTNIASQNRTLAAYVVIDGVTYQGTQIVSMNYQHGVLGERYEVGQCPSAYMEIVLRDVPTTTVVDNKTVTAFIGCEVSGTQEYVPLGTFVVDESSRTKTELTIHCMDKMVQLETEYVSALTYPAQISDVLNEVLTGFTKSITLPSYLTNYTVNKVENQTRRQVLGYISSLCGAFAYVDRVGTFRFKVNSDNPETEYVQEITGDSYFNFNREDTLYTLFAVKLSDTVNTWVFQGNNFVELTAKNYTFSQLTAFNKAFLDIDTLIIDGITKYQISVVSPFAKEYIIGDLLTQISFTPLLQFNMDFIGNPALELGDSIKVIEYVNEGVYNTLYLNIGSLQIKYDGSLSGVLSGVSEGKNKNEFSTSGVISQKVDALQTTVNAIASGMNSGISLAGAAVTQLNIVFGKTLSNPTVISNVQTNRPDLIHSVVSNITSDGATIYIYNSGTATTVNVSWLAISN